MALGLRENKSFARSGTFEAERHRLTRDALARGERLEGLEVTRPTLEEVYLELTAEADSV